jgi:hypothetical protein
LFIVLKTEVGFEKNQLFKAHIVLKNSIGRQKKIGKVKELAQGDVIKLLLDNKSIGKCN